MDSQKDLYTIQQVSLALNIPKPTLRFWEKALDGIVLPLRTQGGQRRYNAEHIATIEDIAYLKKRGMSLSEIREQLSRQYKKKSDFSDSDKIEFFAERIAEVVKEEICNFLRNNSSPVSRL